MKKKVSVIIAGLCCWSYGLALAQTITINGQDSGRIFEGIGALSAGASSRFLVDYPEPYRSDILDFLFKPNFGASLPQLKVETGGDINSTDGSELSYAHTREEFLHPRPAYFNRDYEWWLMKEAQKRNPDIKFEILQWGAPGWVGHGHFYSPENAAFIAGYIKGLKQYHGIDVDYTGIRNEVMYDPSWIIQLRKTLDAEGLSNVMIDAGDQWKREDSWQIAKDVAKDSVLNRAVYAINAHIPEEIDFYTPPEVQQIQKPVWSGESHDAGGDWYSAATIARINNRSYTLAKITHVIYWSLITAYADYLAAPASGMMKANTPWSGNYAVQPPLWMYAHINQFVHPGWKYLDSGCQYFKKEGWSVMTLKDTQTKDYSIIIETMDAKERQTVHFELTGDLSTQPLALWQSAFKQFLFERQQDIVPDGHAFTLTLEPNCIYSLTTTRGQHKGAPAHAIPEPVAFPRTYGDDFDRDSLNRQPPFFINYHGAFEVVKDPHSSNRYLKQCARQQGINWFHQPYPSILIGDSSWHNTVMTFDFQLVDTGSVRAQSRLHDFPWSSRVKGYCFEINQEGAWRLIRMNKDTVLQQGSSGPLGNQWHQLTLRCIGDQISVKLDKNELARVRDARYPTGVSAIATGWNEACFDRFQINHLP